MKYPKTKKKNVIDVLHGTKIIDSYRWLENNENQEVLNWDAEQNKLTRNHLDILPQRKWFFDKLNKLARYDQIGIPTKALKSERIFQYKKKKAEDKWVYYTRENENSPLKELINPNKWAEDETLAGQLATKDGKLIAFEKAKGGNEAPIIQIMNVETGEILPDTLKGWKQSILAWLPDNSGFYYSTNPLKGEVPEGEEHYWVSTYFHKLGNSAEQDKKIWWDDEEKEKWCYCNISEDDKYLIFSKWSFYKESVWIQKLGSDEFVKVTDDFDAEYSVTYHKNKLYIMTNKDAPNKKIYVTNIDKPTKENWQELIPETEHKLTEFSIIAGKIFLNYEKNVQTEMQIFSLDGNFIQNVNLPMSGSAWMWGRKRDDAEIWLQFTSFTFPYTLFKYNFEKNTLEVFFQPKIDIDISNFTSEQVWYESKDGTSVPMFIVHRKDIHKNGTNPVLLEGYGGFNSSNLPFFSVVTSLWLEAGGIFAVASIRGGGEFGEKWHEAGMKANKQNVFDDFIAAGEWLINENYTCSEKLAMIGGSNGGLLIGAVVTQRPDLMKAVSCQVPLLDMIRYHHSSFANIWKEEYGSAEQPEEFEYILKYSPYHNVKDDERYPAMLIETGINDARVDPFHARKFTALIQEKNISDNKTYLLVKKSSGHGGGTTQTAMFEQLADTYSFLMNQLGMKILN